MTRSGQYRRRASLLSQSPYQRKTDQHTAYQRKGLADPNGKKSFFQPGSFASAGFIWLSSIICRLCTLHSLQVAKRVRYVTQIALPLARGPLMNLTMNVRCRQFDMEVRRMCPIVTVGISSSPKKALSRPGN